MPLRFEFEGKTLWETDLMGGEFLAEARPILAEHPLLRIAPHFTLHAGGNRLREDLPIDSQLSAGEGRATIAVRLGKLTPWLAHLHLQEFCRFAETPRQYLATARQRFSNAQGAADLLESWTASAVFQSHTLPLTEYVLGDRAILPRLSFLAEPAPPAFFAELRATSLSPSGEAARARGELMSLKLRTLEGRELVIRVEKAGIWADEAGPYASLLDVLRAVSPAAAAQLDATADAGDESAALSGAGSRWTIDAGLRDPRFRELEQLRHCCNLSSRGTLRRDYRDWNEELQACLSLPAADDNQGLHRARLLNRVLEEFRAAAAEIGCAAIDGELPALAPEEHCYIQQGLFATAVAESEDWAMPRGESALPTVAAVQTEVRNLGQALSLGTPGLHFVHTACVDYRARRMLVQALVPGILNFDAQRWGVYGSLDDGKTIRADPQAAEQVRALCLALGLRCDSRFADAAGAEHTIHGSPDVKVVRGGDGRLYVLDLTRFSPRDANYAGLPAEEGCVLRPELLQGWRAMCAFTEQPHPPLDPSLLTALESRNDSRDADLAALRRPAAHLREQLLPHLADELARGAPPLDCADLTDRLHRLGVNCRYLGRLATALEGSPAVQRVVRRAVFVRSAAKYVRAAVAAGQEFLPASLHAINCLVGDEEAQSQADVQATRVAPALPMAAALRAEVLRIAQRRFGLAALDAESAFLSDSDRLCFVREVCLALGIVLASRSLRFRGELPLRPRDVLAVRPRTQTAHIANDGLHTALRTADAYLQAKELDAAAELLRGCQQVVSVVHGALHGQTCEVLSRQAALALLQGDPGLAVRRQLVAVRLSEHLHGLDDHRTLPLAIDLAAYLLLADRITEALAAQGTALYLAQLIAGAAHPSTLLVLHRFEEMCARVQDRAASLLVAEEALSRASLLYGQSDERLLAILERLAAVKAEAGLFGEASLLQARHRFILAHALKACALDARSPLRAQLQARLDESVRRADMLLKKRNQITANN